MNVKIIPFDKFHGRTHGTIGSSILRAYWLADKWDEASIWNQGEDADVFILQKVYWYEWMKDCKKPIILDLCDPDHWKYDKNLDREELKVAELDGLVDAITCSSEALTKEIKKYVKKIPVITIEDRVNLNLIPKPKKHTEQAEWVVWFGYSGNAREIFKHRHIVDSIAKSNLNLKIISESRFTLQDDFACEIENIDFDWDNFAYQLQEADMVVNPKLPTKQFQFKSNNKTYISWAHGLPVANSGDDMRRLLDPVERQKEADEKYELVKKEHIIEKSIEQYKQLIKEICGKQK